jgi:hypothetical protein
MICYCSSGSHAQADTRPGNEHPPSPVTQLIQHAQQDRHTSAIIAAPPVTNAHTNLLTNSSDTHIDAYNLGTHTHLTQHNQIMSNTTVGGGAEEASFLVRRGWRWQRSQLSWSAVGGGADGTTITVCYSDIVVLAEIILSLQPFSLLWHYDYVIN